MRKQVMLRLLVPAMLAATAAPLQAQTTSDLGAIAGEHVFFNEGGPAVGKAKSLPAHLTTTDARAADTAQPRLPDPSLFTQVPNPNEQVREHAFSLFDGPRGEVPAGKAVANPARLPDPALFTQVPNPNEQVHEHAFSLFGGPRGTATASAPASQGDGTAPTGQTAEGAARLPDPSLFTQVPNPNEQVREHPFNLF